MSNRSLIEFNHDYCPSTDEQCLALGRAMAAYMRGAQEDELPPGASLVAYRHHSDPNPYPAALDLLAALVEAERCIVRTWNAIAPGANYASYTGNRMADGDPVVISARAAIAKTKATGQ